MHNCQALFGDAVFGPCTIAWYVSQCPIEMLKTFFLNSLLLRSEGYLGLRDMWLHWIGRLLPELAGA